MGNCTVYIDESGDLGVHRGTKWFVLSAVVVDKNEEAEIRAVMAQIRTRLNAKDIHLRRITDFYKRAFIVQELSKMKFTYINVVVDTDKLDIKKISSADLIYNYICRILLERVSWFMRDSQRFGDIVLSARGTARDGELIQYIKEKLLPYQDNQIAANIFEKISAKAASSWDMLQLADVCATTMFLTYEKNGWGFCTPCFTKVLAPHLYSRNGRLESYGIKYFSPDMKPDKRDLECNWVCTKNERTPGATTTY